MTGLADTGFLVAYLNRRDQFHDWATSLARQITEPLITCEAVLAETSFHLGSVLHVLALIETRMIEVDFDFAASRERIAALGKRYADRSPDLADLCLISLSERFPKHPVLTVDGDFKIYRRHQRETIPTLTPN
jgi:predicted nucleic acid-binding protein